MKFNRFYFSGFVLLFLTEIAIALWVHDSFIRPYFGDVLVVLLIYFFIKAFLKTPVIKTATGVLLFSYLVEGLQYFNFIALLNLENNKLAKTVIGNSFSLADIVCYAAGFLLILLFEFVFSRKSKTTEL